MLKRFKLFLRLQSSKQLSLGVVEMFYDSKTFHCAPLNVHNIFVAPLQMHENILCTPNSVIVP